LLDERAAQIVAGNLLPSGAPTGPGYLDWLASRGVPSATFQGFAIDIADQGLDNGGDPPGHPDFYENGFAPSPDHVDYAVDYTPDGGPDPARDCGGHGTNVASIAAGFGSAGAGRQDDAGFRYGLGVAPRARLGASKIFTCTGAFGLSGAFEPVVSAAHASGARISNNSWGFEDRESLGAYTVDSQEFDRLVRDARPSVAGNQQMIEVFAAGNQGDDSVGGHPSRDTARWRRRAPRRT
jgi:subtilisin family serine protease